MRYLITVLTLFTSLSIYAQVNITGVVRELGANDVVVGANVIVKKPTGKIAKFATTNSDGKFSMSLPQADSLSLEVKMIGYESFKTLLSGKNEQLDIQLKPGSMQLQEVVVNADRIREQGDTISYTVGLFAQEQDRSIGDVLKRMPGISVENSGKIQYQGEDINKFYIEGSDLLGGRYGIATNGINHDDVGAVEVMENHQPMQVLSGISFSDKAAINLKLKDKAKATWAFHGKTGGGYSWQPEGGIWDGELFAMAVMPSFQNITTFKSNNIGDNLSAQATDFFSSLRETGLTRYVDIALPGVPSLSEKRTLFNRSALVSTNSLWKLGRSEVKTQIDYSYNRVTADALNITTYFLNDGNKVISENRSGIDRSHSLSGNFIYELNQRTSYINNTLKANINWDDVSLVTTGTLANNQTASLPDYYVNNTFKLIKRIKDKHLVTFESQNEWESLPQTLSASIDGNTQRQHINDHAFYTRESVAYAFTIKGMTLSLEGGLKGYLRSIPTHRNYLKQFRAQQRMCLIPTTLLFMQRPRWNTG